MFSFHSKYFVYRELKRAPQKLSFCFKCPDTGQHTVINVHCNIPFVLKVHCSRIKRSKSKCVIADSSLNCWLRGCLHDTGATFAPERVHSGSLSWLYICLHNTTTKCHGGASHPGVSWPRPVRNLATVSCNSWCKRETTTRFGAKSVCRLEGVAHA